MYTLGHNAILLATWGNPCGAAAVSAGRGMVEGPILVEVHPQAALVAVSGGEERGL